MNIDTFLERWNRMGKQRQLITILMSLIKQMKMTEIAVPLDSLDTISSGESLLMILSGEELILRPSPEQTELLTIQESTTGAPWTTNALNPYEKSRTSSTPTDAQLAEIEKRQANMANLRKAAENLRRKGRGLENLTDDLPPLT